MPRKRPAALPVPQDAPVLDDLSIPHTGVVRLPAGAVSCRFQAGDSDTRGLVVRLPDGRCAVFCQQHWGEAQNGIIDEHGALHQGFYPEDIDVLDDSAEPEGDTPEARSAALLDLFWNEINPALEDPYLGDGALEDTELTFRRGDYEEFAQVIRWAAACCPQERVQEPFEAVFRAEGADEASFLDAEDLPDGLEVLQAVADIALDHFGPMGESWEYNDGAYGRQSGYSNYQASFTVSIEPPSAHARIEARERLAAWLHDVAGREPEEIARILGV